MAKAAKINQAFLLEEGVMYPIGERSRAELAAKDSIFRPDADATQEQLNDKLISKIEAKITDSLTGTLKDELSKQIKELLKDNLFTPENSSNEVDEK